MRKPSWARLPLPRVLASFAMCARQVRTFMPSRMGDGLVHVALDEELRDGALHARDAAAGVLVRDFLLEGHSAVPQLLEHLDEVVDQARVAQLQGDLAVVAGRDEGDGPVEDDEALEELLQRAHLDLARLEEVDVRERAAAVPDGVLVEGPDPDTAVGQRLVALQGLRELEAGAGAAGLDGEHLGVALGGGEVEGRVDGVEAFEHGDGVGACRILRTDGEKRLESLGQFERIPASVADFPFDRMQPLCECHRWWNRTERIGVIRVWLQQRQIEQARCRFDVPTCDTSGPQRARVEPCPLAAQLRDRVGMCRFCSVYGQISTPQGPEHART